jgi:DNA gyrase subunit A
VPQAGRATRGKALVNLLPVEKDESISATLAVREFDDDYYIVMATGNGVIKKTKLSDFKNIRANGIIAIRIDDDDDLIGVARSNGNQEIMLASSGGKTIRFAETDVRPMGRSTRGVTGMRMPKGNSVIAMSLVVDRACLLAVSENGYGKRTSVDEYNSQKRGGQGVFTLKTGGRNGAMIAALQVVDEDQVMMMTDTGRLVRIRMSGVSVIGRNTQGVILINCTAKERVIGAVRVVEKQDDDEPEGDDFEAEGANGSEDGSGNPE